MGSLVQIYAKLESCTGLIHAVCTAMFSFLHTDHVKTKECALRCRYAGRQTICTQLPAGQEDVLPASNSNPQSEGLSQIEDDRILR